MRHRSAAPIDVADLQGVPGEGALAARRRRPAAVVPLPGVSGAETPASLRRRRAAALRPAADEPRDFFGRPEDGGDAPRVRRIETVPATDPGQPPVRRGWRQRAASVKSIFNWLKVPGDDLPTEEEKASLLQRMAVREFWQSNIKLFNRLFLALPVIAAAGYLYLIAPDGYQVDAVLAIRNPSNNVALGGSMAGISAALASTGQPFAERAIDESYAVVNFIRSREAFNELEKSMNLSKRFTAGNIDWFHRLPQKSDYEQRYANFLAHTSVSYSDLEGQVTLTTDAYDPETAFQMARELARISERLVNQFNERSRSDTVRLARVQMTEAEDGLRSAMLAMTDLQIKNGMLDPTGEAASYNNIISSLREQVAVKRAELGSLMSNASPDSPRAVEIRNMLASLEAQIRIEQSRLTGRTDALAPLITKFKLLGIDIDLAQQKYNTAAAMVQSAMLQSEHQKLYVVNVVSPSPPMESTIPKRFLILLSVVALTFLAWLIARLILASIRDHSV
jgi:capsular polysaccharide transport system permease protein